jgi:uridine kinase
MSARHSPQLIAIVGGSGAGKTWLADRLKQAVGRAAGRLSLDHFYRDRSHLPPARRAHLNFDHPQSIDWNSVEDVLEACREGARTHLPRYDFVTHTRHPDGRAWQPKPLILMDGLWLLRSPKIRALFSLRIFLDCPARLRLRRRIRRDVAERGRTPQSVRRQFAATVAPMHDKFIQSQARWADIVYRRSPGNADVRALAGRLQTLITEHENNQS